MRGRIPGATRRLAAALGVLLLALGWIHAHAEHGTGRLCTECALSQPAAVAAPEAATSLAPEPSPTTADRSTFVPQDSRFARKHSPRGPPRSR